MKIKKIISAILTCVLVIVSLPVFEKNPVAAESLDWQDYYRDTLYKYKDSDEFIENSRFELCDLNSDTIPELIISDDSSHPGSCSVYTYFNDKFISLGKIGSYGTFAFIPEQNVIISRNIAQGYETGRYLQLKNGRTFTTVFSYYNNIGAAPTDEDLKFKINDEVVSEEFYEDTLAEYESDDIQWLGRANGFDDESIETALPVKNSNWKEVYQQVLLNFKKTKYYSTDSMFDLHDLDGDGIPELIISEGTFWYDRCVVYSVYNNEINCLGEFGDYGSMTFSPKNNIIISKVYRAHEFYDYYKIEDGAIINIFSCNSTLGNNAEKGTFVVNNKLVTAEVYKEEQKKFEEEFETGYGNGNRISLGRAYQLGYLAIDCAFNPPEISLTEEQQQLYLQKLYELKSSKDYASYNDGSYGTRSTFNLFDINNDGTPELIILLGWRYCFAYMVDNGELIEFEFYDDSTQINYDLERNLFYKSGGRMGSYWKRYQKIENGKIITLLQADYYEKYYEEIDDVKIDGYIINGEDASEEEYNNALNQYSDIENTVVVGGKYNFDNDSIASALFLNGNEASFLTQMKTITLASQVMRLEVWLDIF